MEPAQSIVNMLGGPTTVAKHLRLTPGAVSRWSMPKTKGCGGLVPSAHIPELCRLARSRGLFLEPNSFFQGHMRSR
jgi:hypothetical protein